MTDPITDRDVYLLKLLSSPIRIQLLLAIVKALETPDMLLHQKVGICQALLFIDLNKMKDYGILASYSECKRVLYSIKE